MERINQMNAIDCQSIALIAVILISFIGVITSLSGRTVFFYNMTDLMIVAGESIALGFGLFCMMGTEGKGQMIWVIFSLVVFTIAVLHNLCAAYYYNSNMPFMALVIAIARIVLGVLAPILVALRLVSGSEMRKGEHPKAFANRQMIEKASGIAIASGLLFLLYKLVNGAEIGNRWDR